MNTMSCGISDPTEASTDSEQSFVVSMACQEALSSQAGLRPCHVGTPPRICELQDQSDKDTLSAFMISGSMNVSDQHVTSETGVAEVAVFGTSSLMHNWLVCNADLRQTNV